MKENVVKDIADIFEPNKPDANSGGGAAPAPAPAPAAGGGDAGGGGAKDSTWIASASAAAQKHFGDKLQHYKAVGNGGVSVATESITGLALPKSDALGGPAPSKAGQAPKAPGGAEQSTGGGDQG